MTMIAESGSSNKKRCALINIRTTKMISCNQHDYIEIVCMYHYPLKLTMKSGEVIHGMALDTVRNESKEECIKIDAKDIDRLVILSEIKQLDVTIENPHIQTVTFD